MSFFLLKRVFIMSIREAFLDVGIQILVFIDLGIKLDSKCTLELAHPAQGFACFRRAK